MPENGLTLNIGDILHMSMTPEPSNWPSELWNVNRGTPTSRDNTRNCSIKLAEKRKHTENQCKHTIQYVWRTHRVRHVLRICLDSFQGRVLYRYGQYPGGLWLRCVLMVTEDTREITKHDTDVFNVCSWIEIIFPLPLFSTETGYLILIEFNWLNWLKWNKLKNWF